ncbi:unnamed protein product [Paramecium sonneborni]|uniref:Tubby C-terminal domain-containing protein n=1 Tax=Paramecium sonneborni TaxID=65129 RepID=A0A8S1RKR5_9CILI|nr:unnamed protein product [Paramecium sonneborni]
MNQNGSDNNDNITIFNSNNNGQAYQQQKRKQLPSLNTQNQNYEPGMHHINSDGQSLHQIRLGRHKTFAEIIEIQKQQELKKQIEQDENPIPSIQRFKSSQDIYQRENHNSSAFQIKSEISEHGNQKKQQLQQDQPQLFQIIENNCQQQSQSQLQPPLSSPNHNQLFEYPFPQNLDIQYVKDQMDNPEKRSQFFITPLIQNRTLQCYIKIDKSGLARFYPIYHVYTTEEDIYLFSAKKVAMKTKSNYIISMDKKEFSINDSNFLGKVKSNFLGTEFILWDKGKNFKKCQENSNQIRKQLGIVYYENRIMQSKGPRKMLVLLPKVEQNISKIFQPRQNNEGIQYDYQNTQREYIEEFINKPPSWDPQMKEHVLDFYGRVEKPSVKNFQLVKPNNHQFIHLQFGSAEDLVFNLDFCYPLSPLQAFQICITSLDFKFACE